MLSNQLWLRWSYLHDGEQNEHHKSGYIISLKRFYLALQQYKQKLTDLIQIKDLSILPFSYFLSNLEHISVFPVCLKVILTLMN